MKKILFLFFIISIVLAGCSKKTAEDTINVATGIDAVKKGSQAEADVAKAQCIELCNGAVQEGRDIKDGPCVGNPIPNMADWVCDIAHNPRQDVDNKIENQCSFFRTGRAKYFVEVDTECDYIKSFQKL